MRAACIMAVLVFAGPAAAADGAAAFKTQCGGCHTLTGTSGPAGPSLKGVVGRKVASLGDYFYSPALHAKGGVWTRAALDAYVASPYTYITGGKMFANDPDAGDRAAIIAYLQTVK
jgi:cytochrome c